MTNFFKGFQPRPTLSEQEINKGLHWIIFEGTASMGFFSITTSGVLVAFALLLGAENFQIGVLAAIPFLMQLVQLLAITLVEKVRRRKIISVSSWLTAQLMWFPIALIPFLLPIPSPAAVTLLLVLMASRGFMAAFTNASWNSWLRDLVPQNILGRFFSRRMAYATAFGMVFSLGAAFFVDFWRARFPGEEAFGYTWVLLFGAVFLGLATPVFMSLIPEPLMQPVTGQQPTLGQRLTAPLKDHNFRRLVQFLFYWAFTSNLAIPFFAVHMLQSLGISVSGVIALSVLSQGFNLLFLRVWGTFADRYGNKTVLSVGVSLYLLVIAGWIFTTMPDRYFLTVPLLVVLHIFAGIAAAAVNFTVGTIGLKLAPQKESTSYLAVASLATNLGAGFGPLAGGLLADFFLNRQLQLTFTWMEPSTVIELQALSIGGRDFLFGIAFIIGLISLGILALVKEEGEESREAIMDSLLSPMREISRPLSSVPGFNFLNNFPLGLLKKIPLPGLDIAFGVTAYQIAEMAKLAATTAVRGRRMTKKLTAELETNMKTIRKSRRSVRKHGAEIARQLARGAMHVTDDVSIDVDVEQLTQRVVDGVMSATSHSGIKPEDAVMGVSQGVVQGASETGADVSAVVSKTLSAVKESARQIGIPEEEAEAAATKALLQVADSSRPEEAAEIIDGIPEDRVP